MPLGGFCRVAGKPEAGDEVIGHDLLVPSLVSKLFLSERELQIFGDSDLGVRLRGIHGPLTRLICCVYTV